MSSQLVNNVNSCISTVAEYSDTADCTTATVGSPYSTWFVNLPVLRYPHLSNYTVTTSTRMRGSLKLSSILTILELIAR